MDKGRLKTMQNINRRQNCRGFTLMEIMTVIAVVGILSAIAIPNFFAWRESAKLRGATQDLMSDLSMARMHAIKTGEVVKVLFANDGYTIFIDDNDDDAVDAGEDVLRGKKYSPGVVMDAATFSSDKTTFHRSGAVSPAGSVTLDRGSGQKMKIIVNMVGRIRVAAT